MPRQMDGTIAYNPESGRPFLVHYECAGELMRVEAGPIYVNQPPAGEHPPRSRCATCRKTIDRID